MLFTREGVHVRRSAALVGWTADRFLSAVVGVVVVVVVVVVAVVVANSREGLCVCRVL